MLKKKTKTKKKTAATVKKPTCFRVFYNNNTDHHSYIYWPLII